MRPGHPSARQRIVGDSWSVWLGFRAVSVMCRAIAGPAPRQIARPGKSKGTYVQRTAAGLAGAAYLCHGGRAPSHDECAFGDRYSGVMATARGHALGCTAAHGGLSHALSHRGAGDCLDSKTQNDVGESKIVTRLRERPSARLEQVDLRKVWSREAEGFTPWLAHPDNLDLLGQTLGLTLELEAVEKALGSFRADIVCREEAGSYVLIENQLERTELYGVFVARIRSL